MVDMKNNKMCENDLTGRRFEFIKMLLPPSTPEKQQKQPQIAQDATILLYSDWCFCLYYLGSLLI